MTTLLTLSAIVLVIILAFAFGQTRTACPDCTPGLHGEHLPDCPTCKGTGLTG